MSKSEPITSADSDSDDSDGLGLDALYNVEKNISTLVLTCGAHVAQITYKTN